jgi:hypothetical protein
MEWQVAGTAGSGLLRGELEESIDNATHSFLQRVFLTLQALTPYDLLGQPATMTPATYRLRGSQR